MNSSFSLGRTMNDRAHWRTAGGRSALPLGVTPPSHTVVRNPGCMRRILRVIFLGHGASIRGHAGNYLERSAS